MGLRTYRCCGDQCYTIVQLVILGIIMALLDTVLSFGGRSGLGLDRPRSCSSPVLRTKVPTNILSTLAASLGSLFAWSQARLVG
jgi:hypothetical protein